MCSYREPIYIITEFMCHGTLLDFLQKGKGQNFKFPSLIHCAIQVASGMKYLEKEGYINLDLRAGTILVGDNFVCKVAGFHFVRVLKGDEYVMGKGDVLPVRWKAPESIRSHHFTVKSNVWSFAVLLAELFSKGIEPYPGMRNDDVKAMVERGYRMECPIGCSRSLYEIMLKCWRRDPNERPTFEFLKRILEDIFMTAEQGLTFSL